MLLKFRKKEKSKSEWLWEFSKKLVVAVSILYFDIMLYSAVCMVASENYDSLSTLIEQISMVMSDCVFGYFVKAAAENVVKIMSGKAGDSVSDWDEPAG